ncbi:MAG: tRNA dihydrouridine synthase DusB [Thermodesulfobacteriota bacterium]
MKTPSTTASSPSFPGGNDIQPFSLPVTPLTIGAITIDNPFILAPLAGYTDLPFRLLCREYGAGLVFSEMISAHGLIYQQQKTWEMLETVNEERPVIIQLFGAEPDVMARSAAMLADLAIDAIDINMGCPVRKVVKKGAGCALMKTPEMAREIIRAVVANTEKPVTVKFRSGWTHQSVTAPDFARMAEEAGAAAVTIHARTWSDGFSGTVDWQVIAQVKKSVSIPVIGNGDIHSRTEGLAMMAKTGCDGVMIGRAALGRPWVFRETDRIVSPRFRLQALSRHLELIARFSGEECSMGKVRNHAGKYFKGMANGAALRSSIYAVPTFAGLRRHIADLLASLPAKNGEEQRENNTDND